MIFNQLIYLGNVVKGNKHSTLCYDLREVLLFDGIQYAEYSTIERGSLHAYLHIFE